VKRALVVVAAIGCEAREPPPPKSVHWTYAPPPAAFPLGEARGRFGRSQAPQLAERMGIVGEPETPLRLPTPWPVPGAGPARAIVYGLDGERPAVEMIDVDSGRIAWRDETACAGPVVGVSERAVVCADARGTRAIGLDGKARWHGEQTFIAMTDDRVIAAAPGEAVILDADKGDEIARVKLPPKVAIDSLLATCGDAGRELFAFGQDAKLARIAEGKGGPQITWSIAVGNVAGIDACEGASVLVTASTDAGTALVAVARDSGKITGRVDGVLGYWPARDGSARIEVSTAAGVASWAKDLGGAAEPVALPALGELLGKRGELRLVRATRHAAALLDRAGVRAYVPFAEMAAVLGDGHAIAASWLGSPAQSVRRFAVPARYRKTLRVPARHGALAVPAELRDLPPLAQLDESGAIAGAARGVGDISIDGTSVYAIALEADGAGVARADLAARKWSWLRADGCAGPQAIAIAAARDVVACAAHAHGTARPADAAGASGANGANGATVRATGKDGAPRWEWTTDEVDALAAAGDAVIAYAADRASVLDAADGHLLATLVSDDGDTMRAVALDVADAAHPDAPPADAAHPDAPHADAAHTTVVVSYERGRVIARLPRARMVPAWSLHVDGVVRALSASGDGVLVELEDGDAFRVDARTGEPVALAGLDLVWHAFPDVLAGEATGEPVPPDKMPIPPPVIAKPVPLHDVPENPPPVATPWTVPPPGPPAWQLTLYDPAGGMRTRNDYALAGPVKPAAARGPAGSPLVAVYGPGAREALVIDARRGDPVRRVQLADEGRAFSTVVDGKPVAGVVLPNPLRVVLF
jgi:hypothetical protein